MLQGAEATRGAKATGSTNLSVPQLQGPRHVPAHCGLLQPCIHPKLCVYIYVLICRWPAMCLADLYMHAHWSVPIWAADAGGRGES